MVRARSMQEYQDLIKQALFEVEDLRASLEFDEEFMGEAIVFLDPLEASIRELHRSVTDGLYRFSKQNLPFMSIVNNTDANLLPFKTLLIRINETHLHGLEPH